MKNLQQAFLDFLTAKGLKNTPQRRTIIDVFFATNSHLTTEDLYQLVHHKDPDIGQATVYRTLKLLVEAGLAKEMHFGDGLARYESHTGPHHDHLICTKCGKNIEFLDDEIERLQVELAKRYGFRLTSHRMYLYGICDSCCK